MRCDQCSVVFVIMAAHVEEEERRPLRRVRWFRFRSGWPPSFSPKQRHCFLCVRVADTPLRGVDSNSVTGAVCCFSDVGLTSSIGAGFLPVTFALRDHFDTFVDGIVGADHIWRGVAACYRQPPSRARRSSLSKEFWIAARLAT